jgi:uncharacterized membrane protein
MTLYINGVASPEAYSDSATMTKLGQNEVYVKLTDAAGLMVNSNILVIVVNKDPVVSLTSTSSVTDVGLPITYTESVVNGTAPYSINWLVDGQPVSGSGTSFRFVSNSSAAYSVSAQLTDRAGYVVKSTPSTITVNTDPVVSSYNSTGQSTNFFLSNNVAQSRVDISGGTPPYVYDWYLNGLKVAQTSDPAYSYTFSEIGSNLLQVKVSDAAVYNVASETTAVNFGIDFIHIGVVVAIVVVALAIFRLGKGRGSKTAPPEEQEPQLVQPQEPPTIQMGKQEPMLIQPQVKPKAPSDEQESTMAQPQAPTIPTVPTSPIKEEPVVILKLRYARGELTKEEYEEILRTLRE